MTYDKGENTGEFIVTTDEDQGFYEVSGLPVEEIVEQYSMEPRHESIISIREIPGTNGFYNAAAWEADGTTFLLGRQVTAAGEEGEPDIGSLVLLTLDESGNIESRKEVWKPAEGQHLLEDARALPLADGRIALGLTSVVRVGDDYIPRPAVVVTSTSELLGGIMPEPTVISMLGKGDQTTPLGEDSASSTGKNVTAIGHNLFAFRPEGNNHQLRVFEFQEDGKVAHQQYIDFPDNIPWAEWRIGTTMPPVWLNDSEAIFPIHGINIVDGKYVYSIGSARLLRSDDGKLSVDNISQEAIIDPDLFVDMFDDETELHSERRVVYWCGGIPVYDESDNLEQLKGYINVGDKRTVEVTMSVGKLIENWRRPD